MATLNVTYYRDLLTSEKNRLTELCKKWRETENDSDTSIPEDVQGDIRTTIGQAELLMNQRFKQFSGLIDNCEFNLGEKKTTCEDLAGFWDMIYFQVEDVDKKFDVLSEAEKQNWVLTEKTVAAPKQRTRILKPINSTQKSNVTKKTQDAKKRLAEAKAQKVVNESAEKENQKTFEAPGFFLVSSPFKKNEKKGTGTPEVPVRTPARKTTTTPTNSLLITHITRSARKMLSTKLDYDL